jgi:hypothetical protein
MKKFDIDLTILSREHQIPVTKYKKGEERIFNGKDLNSTEYDYRNKSIKTGQFFLYETIKDGAMPYLSYPRLGLLINVLPCDQTIEVEWFDVRRTWEFRVPCIAKNIYGNEYDAYVCDNPSEIKRITLWNDSMNVYDVWDSMPAWKELRRAYEKTIWFSTDEQIKRDRTLRSLLK